MIGRVIGLLRGSSSSLSVRCSRAFMIKCFYKTSPLHNQQYIKYSQHVPCILTAVFDVTEKTAFPQSVLVIHVGKLQGVCS